MTSKFHQCSLRNWTVSVVRVGQHSCLATVIWSRAVAAPPERARLSSSLQWLPVSFHHSGLCRQLGFQLLPERNGDKHSKCELQQCNGGKCAGALCSARECCFSLQEIVDILCGHLPRWAFLCALCLTKLKLFQGSEDWWKEILCALDFLYISVALECLISIDIF